MSPKFSTRVQADALAVEAQRRQELAALGVDIEALGFFQVYGSDES